MTQEQRVDLICGIVKWILFIIIVPLYLWGVHIFIDYSPLLAGVTIFPGLFIIGLMIDGWRIIFDWNTMCRVLLLALLLGGLGLASTLHDWLS
jgi:hypothetical protein